MGNSSSLFSGICTDDHVTRKETERARVKSMNLQYAVSGMKGLRPSMEDRHIHIIDIPVDGREDSLEEHAIFGIFDGHGGDLTSKYLEENFLSTFSKQSDLLKYAELPPGGLKGRADVNAVVLLQKALVKTFHELDEQIQPLHQKCVKKASKNERQYVIVDDKGNRLPAERSGSTGVVVLLTPSHIICANTGDSRAVLRRDGLALPLSFDHKPSELPEKLRVSSNGGFVRGRRVNGDLAVSRAFGDFGYKSDGDVPRSKQKVIVSPDIMVYPRSPDGDEFIILACDGIWDVASNKQCADFVQVLLSEGEGDLGNICEEVLDTCLDRFSRDNMTIMLVGLEGMKTDSVTFTGKMHNALWGHRTTRKANRITNDTVAVTNNAFNRLHVMVRSI